jgi:hypothetical protein
MSSKVEEAMLDIGIESVTKKSAAVADPHRAPRRVHDTRINAPSGESQK